ncbi:unnamed protein product [Schistocephalus solidus]|nr:unnamed protein product [Schistocephalus solidus]
MDAKKTQKLTTSELFGQLQQSLAQDLPGTNLSIALSQYGIAEVEIGQAERQLATDIQKNILTITKDYLTGIWPDIQRNRRSMEAARLDYDAVCQKRSRCTDLTKQRALDAEKENKKAKLDEQIEFTRAVLKQATGVQDKLTSGLKEMAATQMRFYTICLDQMKMLTEKLENPKF